MKNNQNTNEQMNKLQNDLNSFQKDINNQISNLKNNPSINISSSIRKSSIYGNSRYTNQGNDLQTKFQNLNAPEIKINENKESNFPISKNDENKINKQIKIEKHNKYIINKQIINEQPLENSNMMSNKNSQIEEKYENNLNKSPKPLRGGKKSVEIRNIENEKEEEKKYDDDPIKALEIYYKSVYDIDNN